MKIKAEILLPNFGQPVSYSLTLVYPAPAAYEIAAFDGEGAQVYSSRGYAGMFVNEVICSWQKMRFYDVKTTLSDSDVMLLQETINSRVLALQEKQVENMMRR